MINKIKIAHDGCIDEYLDELYEKNNWDTSKSYADYPLHDLEVRLRPLYALQQICGTNLTSMWTGMTKPMIDNIKRNKPMVAKKVQYRKYENGRTYMLILADGYGWDSRVFLNPSGGGIKGNHNLLIQELK